MDEVPLVGGRELTPALLERIRREVVEESDLSRSELARRVCSWLDWTDLAGRPKETSCRIALLGLSRRGLIELPAARGAIAAPNELVGFSEDERESLDCPVAEPGALRAVVVTAADRVLNQLWKRLMTHHYLGPGPLAGVARIWARHVRVARPAASTRVQAARMWVKGRPQWGVQSNWRLPRKYLCNTILRWFGLLWPQAYE